MLLTGTKFPGQRQVERGVFCAHTYMDITVMSEGKARASLYVHIEQSVVLKKTTSKNRMVRQVVL